MRGTLHFHAITRKQLMRSAALLMFYFTLLYFISLLFALFHLCPHKLYLLPWRILIVTASHCRDGNFRILFLSAQLFNPQTNRLGAGDATAIIIPRIHFYNVFSVIDFVNVLLFLCLHLSMRLTVNTKLTNPRYKQK